MKKKEKDKKIAESCQFEEMDQVEEFSTNDFLKGVGVGAATGAVVVAIVVLT